MSEQTKIIYSEVYSIINMLGNTYISKLPKKLFKMIEEEKLSSYNPSYDANISFKEQNIKKETIAMIALFHLSYWCNTNEEKEKLRQLFKDNEEKYQAEIREKYNPDNIFKKSNKQIKVEEDISTNEVAMIEYKESLFKRIINKIKNVFGKII